MCTFEHINNIIPWRNFFFLYLKDVPEVAELATPKGLILAQLDLPNIELIDRVLPVNFGEFVENRMTFLAFIRVSAWKFLLGCLHAFKCDYENVEIEVLFRVGKVMVNGYLVLIELLLVEGLWFVAYECEIGCKIHARSPIIYNEYIFVKLSHIKL